MYFKPTTSKTWLAHTWLLPQAPTIISPAERRDRMKLTEVTSLAAPFSAPAQP